ncbi:MAG TPA: flagellar protein FlgN [Gammaproteobacteria bacterium]|nr:flagellar protein FlgN [Gammaproteobacteria bacterium]
MSNSTAEYRLLILLEIQQQNAVRMLEVLQQEYDALKGNDRQAFEQAMDAKLKHINDLEQQELSSQPELEKIIGSPADRRQLEAFIINSKNPQLVAEWRSLHAALKQCHEQNLLNQRILEASQAQVQQALSLLHGKSHEQLSSHTYRDSGKSDHRPAQGQSIAIA